MNRVGDLIPKGQAFVEGQRSIDKLRIGIYFHITQLIFCKWQPDGGKITLRLPK